MTDLSEVPFTLVKAMTSVEKAMRRIHPLATGCGPAWGLWPRQGLSLDLAARGTKQRLYTPPSSIGRTWSIADIPMDVQQLIRHVEEVCTRFTIEVNRILLTGMSDGGTFALGFGFQKDCPAKPIAPVSCVLPLVDLELAGDRRVYWVHGAQDWMFAVGRAVKAGKEISSAGADVRLKVVPDLSHAYPREENDAILIQLQKLW